ncbi:hypothetical protein [Mesorhizobium marinum]
MAGIDRPTVDGAAYDVASRFLALDQSIVVVLADALVIVRVGE